MGRKFNRTITIHHQVNGVEDCNYKQGYTWKIENGWLLIFDVKNRLIAQFREKNVHSIY